MHMARIPWVERPVRGKAFEDIHARLCVAGKALRANGGNGGAGAQYPQGGQQGHRRDLPLLGLLRASLLQRQEEVQQPSHPQKISIVGMGHR